jgi:hypothetical protein
MNIHQLANPRFALTRDSKPELSDGQQEIVYQALCPFMEERSLNELAWRCLAHGYQEKVQENPLTGLTLGRSILLHLNVMRERGIIREV